MKRIFFRVIKSILILSLLFSCNFFSADTLSEDEYYAENGNEPGVNSDDPLVDDPTNSGDPGNERNTEDLIVTLSYDGTSYRYANEKLFITATFSHDIKSYSIDTEDFICTGGSVTGYSEISNSDPNVYSYRIYIQTDGSNISIYALPESFSIYNDDLTNSSQSNTVEITADLLNHGSVVDFHWSNNNSIVYGLDHDNHELYEINLETEKITKETRLQELSPVAMDFSETDNKLYIVNEYNPKIEVIDMADYSTSFIDIGIIGGNKDIVIDSVNRVIYFTTKQDKLYSVDMDTNSLKIDGATIAGTDFVINENSNSLFTYSGSYTYRYSIDLVNNTLTEEQSIDSGSYYSNKNISISPDRTILCVVDTYGNGSGYNETVYAYDTSNLNNYFNEWYIGDNPYMVFFNPVKNLLYGTNKSSYSDHLTIMSTTDYSKVREIETPGIDYFTEFTTNINGTMAIGYGTTDDNIDKLLFFSDIE